MKRKLLPREGKKSSLFPTINKPTHRQPQRNFPFSDSGALNPIPGEAQASSTGREEECPNPSDGPMTTEDPVMDTLTARLTYLELQPKIWQRGPTSDAGPPGRSPDSPSEGSATEVNATPPEPMEASGAPGESLGSLPAARTEPGEIEGTPGRSSDSPQETEEMSPPPLELTDLVDALGGNFGSLSVECAEDQTQPRVRTLKNRSHRRKPRGGAFRPKPKK